MPDEISCLIVDDHEVVREGLRLSLSRASHIRVIGEASDGASAVQLGDFGGYAGSQEESDLLNTLLAPTLGTSADQVPDLGGLLLGPMVRGATVSIGGETP